MVDTMTPNQYGGFQAGMSVAQTGIALYQDYMQQRYVASMRRLGEEMARQAISDARSATSMANAQDNMATGIELARARRAYAHRHAAVRIISAESGTSGRLVENLHDTLMASEARDTLTLEQALMGRRDQRTQNLGDAMAAQQARLNSMPRPVDNTADIAAGGAVNAIDAYLRATNRAKDAETSGAKSVWA